MTGPLLLDRIVALGPNRPGGRVPKRTWAQIIKARYDAQRFLFDKQASAYVGEFAVGCGDLVIANRQFAIPPYGVTYVEVDSREFFKSVPEHRTPARPLDNRLGYLVVGRDVYCFFERDTPAMSYWRYRVMPPGEYAGEDTVMFTGKLTDEEVRGLGFKDDEAASLVQYNGAKLALTLGGALDGKASLTQVRQIIREIAVQWIDPTSTLARMPLEPNISAAFNGDVRNVWAMLLWLNQTARIHMTGAPAGRKIIRGKIVPYLSHNVVSITLGRFKTVRRAFTLAGPRQSPKGHEVRGHFAHRGGKKFGCEHAWPLKPDENGHWECSRCGRLRWHVKPHQRGDASKGFVTKEYRIDLAPELA